MRRIAPERGAITMEIPLLPGESVTSEKVLVRDGKVIVALGADAAGFWLVECACSARRLLT